MPEIDEADHVDEQSRPLAMGDAGVEQFDALGRLIEHRPHRLCEQFQPHDFGLPQIVHRFALFGALHSRAADRRLQARRSRLR